MKLCSNAIDPEAPQKLDIAIANFVFAKGLSFNLGACPLLAKIISVARTLGENYSGPIRNKMGQELLDSVHNTYYNDQIEALIDEADIFGVAGYGDLATIDKFACVSFLGSGANNSFAILDIVDCSERCAAGQKKSGEYLANKFLPRLLELENREDSGGQKFRGFVDLLLFDGGSNVQKCAEIMRARVPRITVLHGAEHALSLYFKDIFTKVKAFKRMANICRKARNVFCSTRHNTTAMFRKFAKEHNNGKSIGLIKVSECR